MKWTRREFCQTGAASVAALRLHALPAVPAGHAPLLNADNQLERWSFWHNRDWDWYKANIPFWESPDSQIDEIYYYRAEVLTKHLRYASPETGYVFTEFSNADTLPWAGRYNAIASATDLQFEEIRWLKTRQYAHDYARYWMLTPGAQPRNFGFPVAWSTWQLAMVHGDPSIALNLLDHYVSNYEGWEAGLGELSARQWVRSRRADSSGIQAATWEGNSTWHHANSQSRCVVSPATRFVAAPAIVLTSMPYFTPRR